MLYLGAAETSYSKTPLFVHCPSLRFIALLVRKFLSLSQSHKGAKGIAILRRHLCAISIFSKRPLDFLCLCIKALLQKLAVRIEQCQRRRLVIKMAKASRAWCRNHHFEVKELQTISLSDEFRNFESMESEQD